MTASALAHRFADLHRAEAPLVLYNIWDAGSAAAVAAAGAPAIATGSWGMARAQGYPDGEVMPLDQVLHTVAQIVSTVEVPVTLDFEGGYATDPETLTRNTVQVIEAGAVGVNFEDRVVGGAGLYDPDTHCTRIAALRAAADASDVALFINARCDLFFQKDITPEDHSDQMTEAVERAQAYARAGANGFFVPGLSDPDLIKTLCQAVPLPVNIMATPASPDAQVLGSWGVARVSHGPFPFRAAMAQLQEAATEVYR